MMAMFSIKERVRFKQIHRGSKCDKTCLGEEYLGKGNRFKGSAYTCACMFNEHQGGQCGCWGK